MAPASSESGALAPCVALVGPANSGKSTFLGFLDQALAIGGGERLIYLVPGNPDGTGKYLGRSAELRAELAPWVKGRWEASTVSTLREWILRSRQWLELVVVDLGGKLSSENDELFRCCTHFVVVARKSDAGGAAEWQQACVRAGLEPVAVALSAGKGKPRVMECEPLQVVFRYDGDRDANSGVTGEVIERLVALASPRRRQPDYLNLALGREWTFDDVASVGGRDHGIETITERGGPLLLGASGGKAPVWAFGRAMSRALDRSREMAVAVFDPKLAGGFVGIPSTLMPDPTSRLTGMLDARWRRAPGRHGTTLHVAVTSESRLIPPGFEWLATTAALPATDGLGDGPVVLSGRLPIWLALTYFRWLKSVVGNQRPAGMWDASTRQAVFLCGPGAPWTEPWPAPGADEAEGRSLAVSS